MKNRFGSGSCFGLLLGSGGGVGAPDPALHKNLSSCTNFFFFITFPNPVFQVPVENT